MSQVHQSLFRTWSDEDEPWSESSSMFSNYRGAPEVYLVAAINVGRNFLLVIRAHEDGSVKVRLWCTHVPNSVAGCKFLLNICLYIYAKKMFLG